MVDNTDGHYNVQTEPVANLPDGYTLLNEILALNHVYEALGHPRPRYLCYTLLESTEWTLTEPARKISAWENDISNDAVTTNQRQRVYTTLYNSHGPKLVAEGIITFDEQAETITPAEHTTQVLAAVQGSGPRLIHSRKDTHGVR